MAKLRVYKGANHPHGAQFAVKKQPTEQKA
jgi:ribosomal protein L13